MIGTPIRHTSHPGAPYIPHERVNQASYKNSKTQPAVLMISVTGAHEALYAAGGGGGSVGRRGRRREHPCEIYARGVTKLLGGPLRKTNRRHRYKPRYHGDVGCASKSVGMLEDEAWETVLGESIVATRYCTCKSVEPRKTYTTQFE